MNIVLFQSTEVTVPLPRRDLRAIHLLEVLRLKPGGSFDAGLIDGPRGKGQLVAIETETLALNFVWSEPPPPLSPVHVIIGLPRPQTARDILRDLTTLGVASMHFVPTKRGESSYASSSLWKSKEWQQCMITGAAQAFCTRLPKVSHAGSLSEALTPLPVNSARIALDNYEATTSLGRCSFEPTRSVVLAVGSERGWAPEERAHFKSAGFVLADLGHRVLRTETASIAAVTLIKAAAGWL